MSKKGGLQAKVEWLWQLTYEEWYEGKDVGRLWNRLREKLYIQDVKWSQTQKEFEVLQT